MLVWFKYLLSFKVLFNLTIKASIISYSLAIAIGSILLSVLVLPNPQSLKVISA
jgi:hypothetical protein